MDIYGESVPTFSLFKFKICSVLNPLSSLRIYNPPFFTIILHYQDNALQANQSKTYLEL